MAANPAEPRIGVGWLCVVLVGATHSLCVAAIWMLIGCVGTVVNDVLRYEGDNTTVNISDYAASELPTYLRLAYSEFRRAAKFVPVC